METKSILWNAGRVMRININPGAKYRISPLPVVPPATNRTAFLTARCTRAHEKAFYVPIMLFTSRQHFRISIYACLCNLSRFHIAGAVSRIHVPDPGANFIPFYFPIKSTVVTSHASTPGRDAVSSTTEKIAPLKPSRTTLPRARS